jgi:hypothetical protein
MHIDICALTNCAKARILYVHRHTMEGVRQRLVDDLFRLERVYITGRG